MGRGGEGREGRVRAPAYTAASPPCFLLCIEWTTGGGMRGGARSDLSCFTMCNEAEPREEAISCGTEKRQRGGEGRRTRDCSLQQFTFSVHFRGGTEDSGRIVSLQQFTFGGWVQLGFFVCAADKRLLSQHTGIHAPLGQLQVK